MLVWASNFKANNNILEVFQSALKCILRDVKINIHTLMMILMNIKILVYVF